MSEPTPHSQSSELGSAENVLKRLEIDIRSRLDGILHGDYAGLVPGHGSEPGETRHYEPGDDVRRIDWNVTARLQTPHIRQTIADRELETRVAIDMSPSLDFGTANCEKRDLALSAIGALGFLTNRVGNRFGAELILPDGIVNVPARQGRPHLLSILDRVHNAPRVTGTTDLATGIARLDAGRQRRGLRVVISDFLATDGWQNALRRVATRHETLAIEIIDPRELDLPNVGVLALIDPETGTRRTVNTSSAKLRERYAAAAAEQRSQTASEIRRAGADHLILRTDRDWLYDVAQFVTTRRKRNMARAGVGR